MLGSALLFHNLRSKAWSRLLRSCTETGSSVKVPILSAFSTTVISSSRCKSLLCRLSGAEAAALTLSDRLFTLGLGRAQLSSNSGNSRFDSRDGRSLCLFLTLLFRQSLLLRFFLGLCRFFLGLCRFFLGFSFRFLLF